jgi:hypothetical protein
MCNFFSFMTEAKGNKYYFDWEYRKNHLKEDCDSHDHISHVFNLPKGGDFCNKYEYNPLTGVFTIDQINCKDDHEKAEKWVRSLDFKTVVEPLIIKPIVNPFKLQKIIPTESDKQLLKELAFVVDSVGASVWASVRDSVGASVWAFVVDSVVDSVWASVRDSVVDSVWASVRDSVGASVWAFVVDSVVASVRHTVWDSVGAYTGSFFEIKYNVDITPSNKLWERGLVPSFDGKTWRLHSGKNADIVFEISTDELKNL